MKLLPFWRGAVVALLVASSTNSHAADVNARIKGTVTDPAGAVVSGATVTAINQATGVKTITTTQGDGGYIFQQLPIGTYTVTVAANGFQGFSASGIVLNISQEYVEPVKLTVGSATETLEVKADSVQVNTSDMQLNNIVDASQIVAYPLIGRSFTSLELILPGVQASSDRFSNNYSVNGAQSQQSSYLVNGADTNDFALNTIGIQPNPDALDQFNLITGPLNAEYSRNSGAIISTVVKSGTRHFHGDVFEFYRDTFLNSPNFFQYNKAGKIPQKFHQNLFGGTLGGPVYKDKLFFFAAYQGNRAKSPQANSVVTVPTVDQRSGIYTPSTLSATHFIPGTVNIPGCTSAVGGVTAGADTFRTCLTKLNGQLPTSAFNPLSSALLAKYVPAPNVGTNQYTFPASTTTVQDQAIARIDFNPTSRDQVSFVGIYQHQPVSDTLPFTGPNLPGFGDQNTSEIRQMTATYDRQLSSTALNEFSAHYTRFNLGSVVPQNVVLPSTAGFGINPQNAAGASLPLISLTGGFNIGFSTNGPQPRIDQTYQVDDNFSKVLGKHSIKIGFDGRRFNVDQFFSGTNNGAYAFTGTATNPNTSGNVFLDFELGIPSTYSQGAGGRISVVSYEIYPYLQDTWRATNSLTINYGVGYQIDSALRNRQYGGEGVECFVPGIKSKIFPTAPTSLAFPGDPGCNDAQGSTPQYKDVGPRFGFAYAPDLGRISGGEAHKLSIRGGFGIYFNRTEEEGSLQNLSQPPFGITSAGIRDASATFRPAFANPYQDIRTGTTTTNPFPVAFPKPGATNVVFSTNPLNISQYAPNYRVPYAENFQLTIERELPGNIVATASYVGSLARHNQTTIEGNPITQAGHNACLADPDCVTYDPDGTVNGGDLDFQNSDFPSHTQYPQALTATGSTNFNSAGLITSSASSSYHSLELSMRKGPTHGLSGQLSYTFGKSLDVASSFEGAGFGIERGYNQFNNALNYGPSDFDARHRLVLAPIYEIPYHSSGGPFSFRNLLGAGWQIADITTFATGHPYDISYLGGESYSLYCSAGNFYYTCPDVPNQTGPLQRLNPHDVLATSKGQFFNGAISPTASPMAGASFAQEAVGTFGNIGRNSHYGPGIDSTDAQLSKNFHYSADDTNKIVTLRIEGYNVFNHTNFNSPSGYADGSNFGRITSAASGRRFQLVGKLYF